MSTAKKIRQQFLSVIRTPATTEAHPVNMRLYALVKLLIVATLVYVIIFM